MNSYYEYKKVTMMLSDIIPLGDDRTKFYRWKRTIIDIVDQSNLFEKEKKRIILSKIQEEYRDSCEDLYFEDPNMTAVAFINKIERLLGYNQLSNVNINKLKRIQIGKKSVRNYNRVFNDLVQEIKPEYMPSESRLILFYVQGLRGNKEELFDFMFLREFKNLKEAMDVALDLEATYSNMTSIDIERLESIDILQCDEEDIQSEVNLNKLECLDIGNHSVKEYNLTIIQIINGIKKEDIPNERRLIYLYMNGVKSREKVFKGIVFKEFKTLNDVMSFALKLDSSFISYGLYPDENGEILEKDQTSKISFENKHQRGYTFPHRKIPHNNI